MELIAARLEQGGGMLCISLDSQSPKKSPKALRIMSGFPVGVDHNLY